jgi:hypothetical protein
MALKAFGSTYTIQIVPNSCRVTRKPNGLEEGECTFEVTGDPATAGALIEAQRPLGSAHPYRWWLYMETMQLTYTPTGARAVCTYAGVELQWLDRPSYELIIGMEESPIETHPDFNLIGGRPSAPLNGALFVDAATGAITNSNARGVFDSFAPFLSGGAKNEKGGIESYLDPVVTYRESRVSYSAPSASGFGKVSSDVPGPGWRGSLGRRNWLFMGCSYRRRGDPGGVQSRVLYEINNEWRLSGRNGWDNDIYSNG